MLALTIIGLLFVEFILCFIAATGIYTMYVTMMLVIGFYHRS